jgi:uncharacterized membrane protein
MSGVSPTILFEAVSTPPAGLSRRGMRWLCIVLAALAAIPATLVVVLGAWPVLPFLGAEVLFGLGAVALHRRWRRGAVETVRLTADRLTVRRRDGRGGQEAFELEPYWARLELTESAGTGPVLRAHGRGRSVELGAFLAPEEKRSLYAALDAALRAYREPRFDNPQLR